MAEKDIERYFVMKIKGLGGKAYKFVSPGNDGVPDRIVHLPTGIVFYVEFKAPGKKPTPLQMNRHSELRNFGIKVYGCVDSKSAADRIINSLRFGVLPDDI